MKETNSILNHETALTALFKAVGLTASLGQLIRALILASKGQKVFQASRREIATFYRKCSSETAKADVQSVKDKFKSLKKWQAKNQIELVRVVEEGHREREDGKFTYTKTTYELIGLSEFTDMLHSSASAEIEAKITTAIENLKKQYKPPIKKAIQVHPRGKIKRAKKTIYTNFERIFELWQEVNDSSPVEYCQYIVNHLQGRLTDLEDEYITAKNKEKRLAEFEALRKSSNKSKESPVSAY